MSRKNHHHAYQDYNGPRIGGVVPPPLEQQEENQLAALSTWQEGDSLAPPCGSSIPLIHAMLDFASVCEHDVLYDLGCGDGRVLLEANARSKCQTCVGVGIEAELVERAQHLIDRLPADHQYGPHGEARIQVVNDDIRAVLKTLVSPDAEQERHLLLPTPTIVAINLLPEGIAEIEDHLMKLLPTTRIVCAGWGLKSIRPIEEKEFYARKNGAQTTMFLYTNECFERLKGFEYMLSVYNHDH